MQVLASVANPESKGNDVKERRVRGLPGPHVIIVYIVFERVAANLHSASRKERYRRPTIAISLASSYQRTLAIGAQLK